MEAALDFAEDVEAGDATRPEAALERVAGELSRLGSLAHASASRERQPTIVVMGRPNAGKSTLFNALVGSDRAIVTPVPGTTRDAISETFEIAGERVRAVDTAGLRATTDDVEKMGVAVAERMAETADIILYVIDGSTGETAEDREFLFGERRRIVLVVASKIDLTPSFAGRGAPAAFDVPVSAMTGEGMQLLREAIAARLGLVESGEEVLVLDRHREALSASEAGTRRPSCFTGRAPARNWWPPRCAAR